MPTSSAWIAYHNRLARLGEFAMLPVAREPYARSPRGDILPLSARTQAISIGATLGLLVHACSAGTGGSPGGSAGTTHGGGASVAGNGGVAGPHLSLPDASDDATLQPDAACGIGSAEAKLRPVTIDVMFDRSNSMVRPASVDPVTNLNRWQTATGALKAFLADPDSTGLSVALRFFPDDEPAVGCTQEVCDSAACAEVLVDAATLSAAPAPGDAHEARLIQAIDDATPVLPTGGMMATGGTPIYPALQGALAWAAEHQRAHPDGRTVVLFVTDGAPSGCDERFPAITLLASNAREESGVTTFSIGLTDAAGEGLNAEDMDALAEAGGTERAYFIKDGPTAVDDLLSALTTIRGQALPCDFPMPEATTEGQGIDPSLVNVTYTAGDGTQHRFTKVADASTCNEDSHSWYYDDEGAPTRVLLCPAACELVTVDPDARFEILAGCASIYHDPPR